MNDNGYKTPGALEMAVKEAARKSGQDIGQALQNYYHDRFLERIFSEPNPSFVLKGGRGMLARTVNARHTRDTDFLFRGVDLEEAVSELKRLASVDLGDFLEFRFVSAEKIAKDREYRDGYRVVFTPVLGGTKRMNDISVDLVVSQVISDDADIITPASRLKVKGLPIFDYLVYPVTSAIADKVCATMQIYPEGRTSSRVRDLVDLIVYLTTESFSGRELSQKIDLERRLRKMESIDAFRIPDTWASNYMRTYERLALEARLPEEYRNIHAAEQLVKECIDGTLSGEADGFAWSPIELYWR